MSPAALEEWTKLRADTVSQLKLARAKLSKSLSDSKSSTVYVAESLNQLQQSSDKLLALLMADAEPSKCAVPSEQPSPGPDLNSTLMQEGVRLLWDAFEADEVLRASLLYQLLKAALPSLETSLAYFKAVFVQSLVQKLFSASSYSAAICSFCIVHPEFSISAAAKEHIDSVASLDAKIGTIGMALLNGVSFSTTEYSTLVAECQSNVSRLFCNQDGCSDVIATACTEFAPREDLSAPNVLHEELQSVLQLVAGQLLESAVQSSAPVSTEALHSFSTIPELAVLAQKLRTRTEESDRTRCDQQAASRLSHFFDRFLKSIQVLLQKYSKGLEAWNSSEQMQIELETAASAINAAFGALSEECNMVHSSSWTRIIDSVADALCSKASKIVTIQENLQKQRRSVESFPTANELLLAARTCALVANDLSAAPSALTNAVSSFISTRLRPLFIHAWIALVEADFKLLHEASPHRALAWLSGAVVRFDIGPELKAELFQILRIDTALTYPSQSELIFCGLQQAE